MRSPDSITRLPNYPISRFLPALLSLSMIVPGCGEQAKPEAESLTVWRPLGTWSGRGFMQTGPFISDTGSLRLTWEARSGSTPGAGRFKITLHSDVSGRSLLVAVDRPGGGSDTTYINEDPRAFFLVVEGTNLDWKVLVEEGFAATAPSADKR
jgi:hypothetical protein